MPQPYDLPLASGVAVRVEAITPHTFRIRRSRDPRFPEPSLIRYGILHQPSAAFPLEVTERDEAIEFRTDSARLIVRRADGLLALQNSAGAVLTQQTASADSGSGFDTTFQVTADEGLYGLGDASRERIQRRGHRYAMWVRNVASYVPIPYLMSTAGWGLLLNTTWRHDFDVAAADPESVRIRARQGELDLHLFAGETLPSLLNSYTEIAGRPALLPLWAYGLTFVCNQQADAREMLDDALNFRREDIPCDLIGLEPGWMSKRYDYSVDKSWDQERFYLPPWADKGPSTFLGALERLGFRLSLWLCCDYDLSHEEERRAGTRKAPQETVTHERLEDDFEKDQNFGHPAVYLDKQTKPNEPWYEHLSQFVDQGASAFKMDGALQVNEHPDRKWGNGMDDEEMHNLYPTLLNKQMSLGFAEQTGRRPMIYSSGGYTGIQQYSATWAGDTGGGPKPLVSHLNHALSGHANTSCDMDVFTAEGIHFGFLQSWSQVCSWAYWRHPWLLGDTLLPIFRAYAKLRYRLIPYLYSTAYVANQTGLPIVRPMPLAFPDHPSGDDLIHQYLLGDSLLTAAFADRVSLPKGTWTDFWTGEQVEGPRELAYAPPADRGGPLFIRAGAILPMWPEMSHIGQKPVDTLTLHIYPGADSSFTLYEDDGETFGYREGKLATTLITLTDREGGLTLQIGPRMGAYAGMPAKRTFEVVIHAENRPSGVSLEGEDVEWQYDDVLKTLSLKVDEDLGGLRTCEIGVMW